jgi:hypothetical protein
MVGGRGSNLYARHSRNMAMPLVFFVYGADPLAFSKQSESSPVHRRPPRSAVVVERSWRRGDLAWCWPDRDGRANFRSMERAVVVRGRLHGRQIDLDEPVEQPDGEVEVTVRPVPGAHLTVGSLLALIATFPPGNRGKNDIDRQIAEDRAGWDHG